MGGGDISLHESANVSDPNENKNSFGGGALAGAVTKGRKQVLRLSVTQDLMKGSIFMRNIQNSAQKFNEKRCMTRIIMSIISIVLCTAALSASTYAWYLLSVTTGTNNVTTADYVITVSLDTDSVEATATMSTNTPFNYGSSISAGPHKLYITPSGSVSGFAIIEFTYNNKAYRYHTPVISSGIKNEISFTLNKDATSLKVYAHWGAPGNFSNVGAEFNGTISF